MSLGSWVFDFADAGPAFCSCKSPRLSLSKEYMNQFRVLSFLTFGSCSDP